MSDELPTPLPFRVVVAPSSVTVAEIEELDAPAVVEEGDAWSLDDIEAAYQQALESQLLALGIRRHLQEQLAGQPQGSAAEAARTAAGPPGRIAGAEGTGQ